ncbi:hypothetical protein Gogos_019307 [Gossypium gossypioides]|uniref:Uncharacterized protein n=1 Tax=Gossypium gossypioides TaxID=34282 RepID=A0A7J9BH32_GOSGO|nr:hypothetical protein [Gossypium gossypioides]
MAMLGMQADMQHKSHFPGCYTAWDLNLDANGNIWPTDNDVDRILRNRQYYNGTLPPSSGSNMFYNKVLLKQTMLKHEAEFKDQIRELHQLYRRQKELVEEMKKSDLYKHHCSLDSLQANNVLCPKSPNCVQIPHHSPTSINIVHCQPPISETKGSILPLHSYDGNTGDTGVKATRIGSSSKASEFMESNCKMFGKKVLDLELPADEYFDSEEEGFSEVKPVPDMLDNALKKIPEVRDRGDEEQSIRGSDCNYVFPGGNFIPGYISSKKKILADLNIPVELEEDIIPESSGFKDPIIGHKEPSLQDPSGKSNSNFHGMSKEASPNSQMMGDPEAHWEILRLDKHKMQREHEPSNDKAGHGRNHLNSFPRDLCTDKSSTEHVNNVQADCVISHGLDETNGKLCNENLQHVARDISASNSKPDAISGMRSSYQVVPLAEPVISESSSVSSWRRAFKHSPIAVQALPCFKGKSSKSLTLSPSLPKNEHCLDKNLVSSRKSCSATFPRVSWLNDSQLEGQPLSASSHSLEGNNDDDFAFENNPVKYAKSSKYMRSVKSLDLNIVSPSFSTDVAGSQDGSRIHGENMFQSSTVCSPRIAETLVHDRNSGERRDFSIPLESTLEQANSPSVLGSGSEEVQAGNSLDFKKMFGFYMHNKPPTANGQCSAHASPSQNCSDSFAIEDIKDKEKDRIPDINLEFHHVPGKEKLLDKTESVAESDPCEKCSVHGGIDLNSCLSMNESQLAPSNSIEIDLEPPASPENKECSPPRGESNENLLETPMPSSGQDDGDLQEALVRNAVEAIVSISSSKIRTCLERTSFEPFKVSNSLYWFARVASSVVDDPGSEFGISIGVKDNDDNEQYLSDGIDYFEAMTLNLAEIKVEESWCKSNGGKEEEPSAMFLKNQPKRGRTRRGRQRKDFQSEILPSLASLSRYEVTEDLQIIGGLMEATGTHWESSSSRIAGRNGYTKGRRRTNARAASVTGSMTNTMLQSGNTEVGIQPRRLIDWGKITRRPRGPRCPSSNPRLILGQV